MALSHLVVVSYSTDAERKRIEYIASKHNSNRIKGIKILVDDENISNLTQELKNKTTEKIEVYSLSPGISSTFSDKTLEVKTNIKLSVRKFWILLRFSLSKYKVNWGDITLSLPKIEFTIRGRKGITHITITTAKTDRDISITILISGQQKPVDFFYKVFCDALRKIAAT